MKCKITISMKEGYTIKGEKELVYGGISTANVVYMRAILNSWRNPNRRIRFVLNGKKAYVCVKDVRKVVLEEIK